MGTCGLLLKKNNQGKDTVDIIGLALPGDRSKREHFTIGTLGQRKKQLDGIFLLKALPTPFSNSLCKPSKSYYNSPLIYSQLYCPQ